LCASNSLKPADLVGAAALADHRVPRHRDDDPARRDALELLRC